MGRPGAKSSKTPYRGQQDAAGGGPGVRAKMAGDKEEGLMELGQGGIDGSKSVRDMHHLRLMSLLQEQVRDHGRRRAAEILGVDRRTLDTALEQGMLTRRIRGALEKALQSGVGSAAAQQPDRNDLLADRLGDLESLVEEQGKEMREGRRAAEDAIREMREAQAQALRKLDQALAQLNPGQGVDGNGVLPKMAGAGPQARETAKLWREYPELVTLEPAEDDEDVFGDAWALIQEWRKLKETHPSRGRGLDWLRRQERLLKVELALLGGARADPAAGDVPVAGPGPGRPGQLAAQGAV